MTRSEPQDRAFEADVSQDALLRRFRAALDDLYGDRIERAVLFGSRARGDARVDSDYDVAVFLKDLPDYWGEMHRMAFVRMDLLDETGAFIDMKVFAAQSHAERTPIMHEIRKDGRDF